MQLERKQAIAAARSLIGRKLLIETGADLTPVGKRTSRVVKSRKSKKLPFAVIAWYVGGKFYKHLTINESNLKLTRAWSA